MSAVEEMSERELRLRRRIDSLQDERDQALARVDQLERDLVESRRISRGHYNRARKLQRDLKKLQEET